VTGPAAHLVRWSRLLTAAQHDAVDEESGLNVATDLAAVTLGALNTDELVIAVAVAKKAWSDATVARMLSTMRGVTRWPHPPPTAGSRSV
jgi:hypothetical protein